MPRCTHRAGERSGQKSYPEGARQGSVLPALVTMTDHRAVVIVVGYFQAGAVTTNTATHLFDGRAPGLGPR